MTEGLIFNGKKYIPSKQAADLTGYEMDYVGQLCRAGKVESKRIGRVWFVGEEAILKYKADSLKSTEQSQVAKVSGGEGVVAGTFSNHKSDNQPETSLPSHFHLFGEVSKDSMSKLLSLFVVAVLFASIVIAKNNNSFPLAYGYLKSIAGASVAGVEFSVSSEGGISGEIKKIADSFLQDLNKTGENVLAIGSVFGKAYLGIINEASKVAGLFVDSSIADYPGKIFASATKSFEQLYRQVGFVFRQESVAVTSSKWIASVVNYPTGPSQNYISFFKDLSGVYRQLGSNLRTDINSLPGSKVVAVLFGWPEKVSGGISFSIQAFPVFYENLGRSLGTQVADLGKSFVHGGIGISQSASVETVSVPDSGIGQKVSPNSLNNKIEKIASDVTYRLRIVRGEVARGFVGGFSMLQSVLVKVKSIPVALYRSVAGLFSGDYYLQLTQALNRNQTESESNLGGVIATESRSENLGIAVVPSTDVKSDELAKKQIRESFSDDVEVIPDETGQSGIIKPNFKSGRSSAYVYVLVPVKQ